MEAKLIITKQNNHIISALFEDDKIAELSVEPVEEKKLLDNHKNMIDRLNSMKTEQNKMIRD